MSKKAKDISINFTFHDDSVETVQGAEGDSLLDLVVDNNIGGRAGGREGIGGLWWEGRDRRNVVGEGGVLRNKLR